MSEIKSRGARLKELLDKPENKNKTPKYLAERTEKSRQYIYKLINDEMKNADRKALKIIADELGVTLDYLEFGTETDLDRLVNYEDSGLSTYLPPDLRQFVVSRDAKPYLVLAQHLSKCDLDRLTASDMEFLIGILRLHIEKHNNSVE